MSTNNFHFRIGLTGFCILPLGMEVIIEETYPLEPSTGSSIVFVGAQLSAVLCIILSGVLERPLKSSEALEIEVFKIIAFKPSAFS